MAEMQGVASLVAKLQARAAKVVNAEGGSRPVVEVGFTAVAALWVHENTEMKLAGLPRPGGRGFYWDPQGRAGPKFLEGPAREMRDQIWNAIYDGIRAGMTLAQALIRGGLLLQRESQERVPVDRGELKASAFTRLAEVEYEASDYVNTQTGSWEHG